MVAGRSAVVVVAVALAGALLGNSGKDELFGEQDDDELDRGSEVDSCAGGKGADSAKSCEQVSGV